MRTRISNIALPGYASERVPARSGEEDRSRVFDPDGHHVGDVVYVRRPHPSGSECGWRPDTPHRWSLLSKVDAARRCIEIAERAAR